MKVALGLKAHSGWAALVVIGISGDEFQVIDRRRIELVEEADSLWAKQPYHAAEELEPDDARDLVKRGMKAAYRVAGREMKLAIKRLRERDHKIVACAVLVPNPMPMWSTEEILAVHFRMHKAEGVLFPDALAQAARGCGLKLITIPEKTLNEHAEKTLTAPLSDLMTEVTTLGKSIGSPWGKDQKNSALAAMIALRGNSK
jgi:hypothetical protein